jgi:hypothetical protein
MQFFGFDQPELPLDLMASRGLNWTTASVNFSTTSALLTLEPDRQGFGF